MNSNRLTNQNYIQISAMQLTMIAATVFVFFILPAYYITTSQNQPATASNPYTSQALAERGVLATNNTTSSGRVAGTTTARPSVMQVRVPFTNVYITLGTESEVLTVVGIVLLSGGIILLAGMLLLTRKSHSKLDTLEVTNLETHWTKPHENWTT